MPPDEKWRWGDPEKVYERIQSMRMRQKVGILTVDPFGEIRAKGVLIMTQDESSQVEDLLMVWFIWAKGYRPHLGAPRVSAYGRITDPQAGDTYADQDDRDARIDTIQAEMVDACLDGLSWQARAAVGIHTANRQAGNSVYRNPRLTAEQQHQEYQHAKVQLLPLLRRKGLIRIVSSSTCNLHSASS